MSKTIINTSRRTYWFDETLTLHEITDTTDIFYDVEVLEPVNEGQFRNLYISTNNYRAPKRWDGEALEQDDLGGLIAMGVVRARTMEINNSHVIFANIAKNGGGPGATHPIDSINEIIDTVSTIIDAYGFTPEQGYRRFNKTAMWSDINRPEYYIPERNNQAGDLDFDETGDEIVRVKKLAEFNVMYKEKSIWLLIHVGLPFVYVKKFVTNSVGLLAVNAIVEAGGVHYFVGADFDFYRFDGVNATNVSQHTGIRDYVVSRIDREFQYETHAYADTDRKEIQFSFHGKEDSTVPFRDFDIIYNYETQAFSKKDSVAKCGSYFEQSENVLPIIDDVSEIIDNVQDTIDRYKILGIPKWKPIIGDREGQVHLYNEGDSFNGEDIIGEYETGDEDYSVVSRGAMTDHIKLLSELQLLVENQGIAKEFEFYLGGKDQFDGNVIWHGPFRYRQDASQTAILKCRGFGVYHRFRFKSPLKHQYIRIVGYAPEVTDYGEVVGR